MANSKTGIWAALGAVAGGLAGAQAGKYASQYRPRGYHSTSRGHETEDAMVIGGAVGSVIGAFVGGTMAGEDEKPQLTK